MSKNQSGFTLVEALVYLALFSTIFVTVVLSVYYLNVENRNVQAKSELYQEANFLLRKLDWAIIGATSIAEPNAGATGQQLLIIKSTGKIEFRRISDVVNIEVDSSGINESVTSSSVKVTDLTFKHVASIGGKPEAVIVSFTISDNFSNSQVFTLTRNLRQ